MLNKAFIISIGIFLKLITFFIPKNKHLWIFGAQNGQDYIENSKYFFEYIKENKKEETPIWISRNKLLIKELSLNGIKAYYNFSLKGVVLILRAKYYVFSTIRSDVLFFFKTPNRRIINLWHGMPIKKIVFDYNDKETLRGNKFNYYLWETFAVGFKHNSIDYIAATSDFFVPLMKSAFRNENVFADGLPRNDIFGINKKMEIKKKYGIHGEVVVTYMPTHRAYGKGEQNPIIFKDNNEATEYFKQQNVEIVLKFHKNMIASYENKKIEYPISNLTLNKVDPQELLYISDILITDYSSCFIDYMLMKRPIIFYHYDNYETDDNELYFRLDDFNIGTTVKSEKELFILIKDMIKGKSIKNNDEALKIFHNEVNFNSSEKVYNRIKLSH